MFLPIERVDERAIQVLDDGMGGVVAGVLDLVHAHGQLEHCTVAELASRRGLLTGHAEQVEELGVPRLRS
jgi:hypothetical protein